VSVFLLSFTVIAIAFLGMAVGILFGRPPLNAGSCGQRGAGCFGTGCGCCAEGRRQADTIDGSIAHRGEQ
jgi:hypothetical protein